MQVYCILDEFIIGGEIQETSKKVGWVCLLCLPDCLLARSPACLRPDCLLACRPACLSGHEQFQQAEGVGLGWLSPGQGAAGQGCVLQSSPTQWTPQCGLLSSRHHAFTCSSTLLCRSSWSDLRSLTRWKRDKPACAGWQGAAAQALGCTQASAAVAPSTAW